MVLDIIYIMLGLIGGYALGSIPFGLVFTRIAGLVDIRDIGSKSIGATNVLRTGRKDLALLTLICDSGKGAVAVFILGLIAPYAAIGAALGSVLGHLYPVWLQFKGGKGVACAFGVILVITPVVGLFSFGIWLAMAFLSRISSLSALVTSAIAPIIAWGIYGDLYAGVILVLSILIWVKHKDNISRITKGTEPKIGAKK